MILVPALGVSRMIGSSCRSTISVEGFDDEVKRCEVKRNGITGAASLDPWIQWTRKESPVATW